MKYVILADSSVGFETPRQLTKINGEPLIKRTIRLLKENGIKNIIITSHDERFDNLGATRYEPLYNDYIPNERGYWISAFPIELLNEPICFLMGDVYYSEKAIKTIIETPAYSTMFFCTYQNNSIRYIKHHDEPLAFKVVDYIMFKEHIERIKDFKDSGQAPREPIIWELYRSINNQPLTKHYMTTNYTAINDESCDIDTNNDIIKLQIALGGKFMVKLQATQDFTLEAYNQIKITKRANEEKKQEGWVYANDELECNETMANYLTGGNDKKIVVAKILEVIPEVKKNEFTMKEDTTINKQTKKKRSKK